MSKEPKKLSELIDYNKEQPLYNKVFHYHQRHPEKSFEEIVAQYRRCGGCYSNEQLSKRIGERLAVKVRCYMSNHKDEKEADVIKMFQDCEKRFGDISIYRYQCILSLLKEHPEYEGKKADELWKLYQKKNSYNRLKKSLSKNRGYFRASMRMSYYLKHGNKEKAEEMRKLRDSFKVGNN